MTLVCTLLGAALHFRGPSHSPRFLLALLILTFPTLLITLLAFLVDILLFIPHMAWGGWIVLAATIIITVCSVLTCAMRRTLVSRKARKKRIDENNDMNGENFYAMKQAPGFARAESPPPIQSEGTVTDFARPTMPDHTRMSSTDDRRPLNPKESNVGTISTSEGPARDLTNAANTDLSGSTAATPVIAAAGAAAVTAAYRDGGGSSTPDAMAESSRDPRLDRDNRRAQQGPYRDGTPRGATRQTPQFGRGAYQPPSRGMAPRAGYRGGYGPSGRGSPGPNYGQRGGYQPMPGPGWNGQGRGMPGQGPPGYGPGPYGALPGQRQYEPNYVPQMSSAGTTPQPYGIQNAPIEPGPWNGETQQDDANNATGAVIDAYNTGSPEMPTAPNYARRPSGGIERDAASFGFSGRRSPARGSTIPRSSSPVPPVPTQYDASPEAVELDSVPLMAAPQGGASELEGRGTVHELQG